MATAAAKLTQLPTAMTSQGGGASAGSTARSPSLPPASSPGPTWSDVLAEPNPGAQAAAASSASGVIGGTTTGLASPVIFRLVLPFVDWRGFLHGVGRVNKALHAECTSPRAWRLLATHATQHARLRNSVWDGRAPWRLTALDADDAATSSAPALVVAASAHHESAVERDKAIVFEWVEERCKFVLRGRPPARAFTVGVLVRWKPTDAEIAQHGTILQQAEFRRRARRQREFEAGNHKHRGPTLGIGDPIDWSGDTKDALPAEELVDSDVEDDDVDGTEKLGLLALQAAYRDSSGGAPAVATAGVHVDGAGGGGGGASSADSEVRLVLPAVALAPGTSGAKVASGAGAEYPPSTNSAGSVSGRARERERDVVDDVHYRRGSGSAPARAVGYVATPATTPRTEHALPTLPGLQRRDDADEAPMAPHLRGRTLVESKTFALIGDASSGVSAAMSGAYRGGAAAARRPRGAARPTAPTDRRAPSEARRRANELRGARIKRAPAQATAGASDASAEVSSSGTRAAQRRHATGPHVSDAEFTKEAERVLRAALSRGFMPESLLGGGERAAGWSVDVDGAAPRDASVEDAGAAARGARPPVHTRAGQAGVYKYRLAAGFAGAARDGDDGDGEDASWRETAKVDAGASFVSWSGRGGAENQRQGSDADDDPVDRHDGDDALARDAAAAASEAEAAAALANERDLKKDAAKRRAEHSVVSRDAEHIVIRAPTAGIRAFRIPSVGESQEDVFAAVGPQVCNAVWLGYNATVMVYGQTASGKTHTVFGTAAEPGLAPRIGQALLNRHRDQMSGGSDAPGVVEFRLCASFVEVYRERVYDLLADGKVINALSAPTQVKPHGTDDGVFSSDIETRRVFGADSLRQMLTEGQRNRAAAATTMNSRSSRSHAILTLHLSQTGFARGVTWDNLPSRRDGGRTLHSFVRLVDLAGSERFAKSGNGYERAEEMKSINASLSALGRCINLLEESRKRQKGRTHVPFRDSVMTRLLRSALGGDAARTFLVATVSQTKRHLPETLSTLRFAERTSYIRLDNGAPGGSSGTRAASGLSSSTAAKLSGGVTVEELARTVRGRLEATDAEWRAAPGHEELLACVTELRRLAFVIADVQSQAVWHESRAEVYSERAIVLRHEANRLSDERSELWNTTSRHPGWRRFRTLLRKRGELEAQLRALQADMTRYRRGGVEVRRSRRVLTAA